jgi:hypothetical protein
VSSTPLISFAICSLFAIAPLTAQQKTRAPEEFVRWLPISDAERQQKAPQVEKDAGAEILLWRVHVVDELVGGEDLQRVLYHYLRVKVFDERGKTAVTTVNLPYRPPGSIQDVSGRTVKADGSIVDLDGKTIYRRDLTRIGGIKEKVVTFALPGVEPGAIVEYRWREIQNDNRFRYLRLKFARDLPVQQVTYFVRPLSSEYVSTEQMFLAPFNCQPSPMKMTNDGWNAVTVDRIPASREEPYAISSPNVEPWALLYYRDGNKDPKKYWEDLGKKRFNSTKAAMKGNDELKAAGAKIKSGGKNETEKIELMVAWVRANLRDFFSDAVTDAQRADLVKKLPSDRDRTAAEIVKSGIAFDEELNVVLAALAAEVGFEARLALVADSNEMDFNANLADIYFLDNLAMAIKLGIEWKIFDVGHRYLKPGMMPSNSEGVFALITDGKEPAFVRTSVTPPEGSAENRDATLRLAADGALEGDVKETYTGHRAAWLREEMDSESDEERDQSLKDRITRMFPGAKITALTVENQHNPAVPLEVKYHFTASQFAQATGRRLLFQPNAFRRADATPFTAAEHRLPIRFPYAWMETDQIRITLPEGFTLENPENPGNMDFGQPGGYMLAMQVENRDLVIRRQLIFGKSELLNFQPTQYPILKQVFEQVHLRDSTSVSLRAN